MKTVLLTDYAWNDVNVERAVIEGAGFKLVVGPAKASSADAIAALAARHDPAAIMTCWAEVTANAIESCSSLTIVARVGVGLDNIDCHAAARSGAVVTNVPDYCVEEVSDHAVGFLLNWARGLTRFSGRVKAGYWDPTGASLTRVRDMTVGIVGFGRIGRRTAQKISSFGCRILVSDIRPPAASENMNVEFAGLEELVSLSDVIILHVPLTSETRHLFSKDLFEKVKPGSLLINVSRGGLVDNDALIAALDHGQLGAAALDVIDGEPNPPSSVIQHERIVATPHIAFLSEASLIELRRRSSEEVVRVLNGQEPHHPCLPGAS